METSPASHLDGLISRWPEKLVDRIDKDDWVLVVGAGLSRQASNGKSSPKSWTGLIEELAGRFTSGDSKKVVDELVRVGQYLDAAEVVKQCAVEAGKKTDFLDTLRAATDGPQGNSFKPGAIHSQLINELAPRLIVTTNYDKIIERASEDAYNVHRPGDLNLGADVRTGSPALIKPHGTVDDLTKIVLTRSDYAVIRHEASELYRVMEAVFLTKTCFFIGYSFQDPDLMLLLENSFAGKGRAGAHYWLAPDDAPTYFKQLFQQHYGVEMVPYSTANNHKEMNEMLDALCLRVSGSR
jgi:hypothetical protein